MYTRSYSSRPSTITRPIPPDYSGTALVIPQPETDPSPSPHPEPPSISPPSQPSILRHTPPSMSQPPTEVPPSAESRPPQAAPSPSSERPRRPRFSSRRNRPITAPSMPTPPDYDSRRSEEAPPSPANRRDPLGAPPFGGLGLPPQQALESLRPPLFTAEASAPLNTATAAETETVPAPSSPPLFPFSVLALRQDDLLLLGLLLFLLHEQDDSETDCRDALLLLAALFVAGM